MEARLTLRARAVEALLGIVPGASLALAEPTANLAIAAAIVALAGYVAMFVWLRKVKVVLDEQGIMKHGWFRTTSVMWDRVDYYTFDTHAPWIMVGGDDLTDLLLYILFAIPNFILWLIRLPRRWTPNRYVIDGKLVLHHGKESIAVNHSFRDIERMFDYAFARLHPRLRERHDFAPFVFDAGLRHDGKLIERWKQFEKASVSREEIHNVVLLFERMAELGIEIDLDRDLFLPDETLAKIRSAGDVPRARLAR